MKRYLIATILFLSFCYGEEARFILPNNKEIDNILNNDRKISLNKNDSKKSIGYLYLENDIKKNNENLEYLNLTEIYSVTLSTDWKGSIFEVEMKPFTDKKTRELRKVFYNDSLVVTEIYNTKAEPMSKLLKLPLVSKVLAYNKSFQINELNTSKENTRGKDLVIFSNPESLKCKKNIPNILNFGVANNMNIYFYNLSSSNYPLSKDLSSFIITTMNDKKIQQKDKVEIIKKIYKHNFNNLSKSNLLDEFNKIANTKITLSDVNEATAIDVLNTSNKMSEKLYITLEPTIYIDGLIFDDYEEL